MIACKSFTKGLLVQGKFHEERSHRTKNNILNEPFVPIRTVWKHFIVIKKVILCNNVDRIAMTNHNGLAQLSTYKALLNYSAMTNHVPVGQTTAYE